MTLDLAHLRRLAEAGTSWARATDEEMKEAGYDPKWISERDADEDGPYMVCRVFGEQCPCCHGQTDGFAVLNTQSPPSARTTFYGEEGEVNAEEHARLLNAVWLDGARRNAATILALLDRLEAAERVAASSVQLIKDTQDVLTEYLVPDDYDIDEVMAVVLVLLDGLRWRGIAKDIATHAALTREGGE